MQNIQQTKTTPTHNIFVSVNSIAERYDVSPNTVWRWTREGDFPKPVKLGIRSTRWRLSDLEEWEAQS